MTETLKITHSNRVRRPLGLARRERPTGKPPHCLVAASSVIGHALSDHCVVFALQTVDGSVQEETNASADVPRPPVAASTRVEARDGLRRKSRHRRHDQGCESGSAPRWLGPLRTRGHVARWSRWLKVWLRVPQQPVVRARRPPRNFPANILDIIGLSDPYWPAQGWSPQRATDFDDMSYSRGCKAKSPTAGRHHGGGTAVTA